MAFMIVFINGLCLIVMTKTKALSNPSDILLKCMVISDLLMGALPVPFWLVSWLLAYHFYPNCPLYRITILSGYFVAWVNYLLVSLITLDRYMSMCQPYCYAKWSGNQHIFKIVLVLVFICSFIAVSSMFLFGNFTFQVIVLCFVILVILIVNITLYAKISQNIKCIDNYYSKLVGKQFATNKVTSLEKKGQFITWMMLLTLTFPTTHISSRKCFTFLVH